MLSEFDLIARYFTRPLRPGSAATLGVGDDCALLAPAAGMQLAISTDMLVEGRHFFAGADPALLGHKCLAVNLSDLAAMGARPLAFTLALALPAADEAWLAPFAQGMFALADLHGCELVGGDTTRGPLTVSITVFGEVPKEQALRRSNARVGDDIWVSGTLGEARLALAALAGELALDAASLAAAAPCLHAPAPRVALGLALRGVASAAIDISDGLAGDLGHILKQSGVGAVVDIDGLPAGPTLALQPPALQRAYCIAGGDDYELCFTAAPERRADVLAAARASATPVSRIGVIEAAPGLRLVDAAGRPCQLPMTSFDHFASP
ncbi:thiamine-phosphate kinase [Noviherbaspirillum sedimenti]|uniref:Thiamine-monophosphate kinase n=1 Tax=Noviherbaspirillum sedimenti TaxID=2320865 RepID=A0A3A3G7S0_9BURK|nr:thiamine-phosphate kinase [Noviherbaspirillum sedimenti]RJG03864.1 thiamine-phosphate kinase [Noviherbaspirillum sedimenti]